MEPFDERPDGLKSYRHSDQTAVAVISSLTTAVVMTLLFIGLYFAFIAPRMIDPEMADQADSASGFSPAAEDPECGNRRYCIRVGDLEMSVPGTDQKTVASLEQLTAELKSIYENYYEAPDTKQILDAMTRAMPSAMGSPYTYYLDPEQVRTMVETGKGEYSGIGATVSRNREGVFEIQDVHADSPAERAGLLPLDLIVKVEGEDAGKFADVLQLASVIKGAKGSNVNLEIYRPSDNRRFTVDITRDDVIVQEVRHRTLKDAVSYIQVVEFSRRTPEQFRAALQDAANQRAKALILDLRNNPGGDAAAVCEMLDMLLPEGEIAKIKGRRDGEAFEEVWESKPGVLFDESIPIRILINERSASASELFSGCMRDRGRASLVGVQSFGKGSGTVMFDLPGGSAVNVTIFRYFLPAGDCIEGVGLKPDLEVAMESKYMTVPIEKLSLAEDTQLQKAVASLRSESE